MFKQLIESTKVFLTSRKRAYQLTFNPEDRADQMVLKDLAKFCRAYETTFHNDPRAHSILEGRREVWLRIQNHLQLSEDQLWELYGRKDLE